jgi:hypothetical protein
LGKQETAFIPVFKGLENLAERVGFESALECGFNNIQSNGWQF